MLGLAKWRQIGLHDQFVWSSHNLKAHCGAEPPTRTGNLRVMKVQTFELDQVSNADGNYAWRRWG